MQAKFAVLIFLAVLLSPRVVVVQASSGEIDETAVVDWVYDGDTFNVTSGEKIRLADVDTPENGETGYFEAKYFMIDLVGGKTVYLDIDDISRTDPYGRLVCVVYVDYNSTHYENVNKALLVGNYAELYDHNNNEFNPSTWALYIQKSTIPEFPSFIVLPALIVATLVGALIFKRKWSNKVMCPFLLLTPWNVCVITRRQKCSAALLFVETVL